MPGYIVLKIMSFDTISTLMMGNRTRHHSPVLFLGSDFRVFVKTALPIVRQISPTPASSRISDNNYTQKRGFARSVGA